MVAPLLAGLRTAEEHFEGMFHLQGTAPGLVRCGQASPTGGGCEMQATHGPGFRGRGRGRLLGWLIGLAALSAMIMPTAASAVFTPPPTEAYLALGDALAFGFSTQKYHEGEVRGFEDPELFEHGYPNFYLKSLQAKDLKLNKEKGEKKYD